MCKEPAKTLPGVLFGPVHSVVWNAMPDTPCYPSTLSTRTNFDIDTVGFVLGQLVAAGLVKKNESAASFTKSQPSLACIKDFFDKLM